MWCVMTDREQIEFLRMYVYGIGHTDGNEITCRVDQDMRLSRYHGLFDKSMFIIDRYLILGVISNANEQNI